MKGRVTHEDRRHRRHRLEGATVSRRRPQQASATTSRYPSSQLTEPNGYFRAKVAQEKLIVASGIPYTIIRATQFLELLGGIADSSAVGNIVRLFRSVEPAQFARTRRVYSFIRVIRRDESPRRTVQYPPFDDENPQSRSEKFRKAA